MYYYDQYGWLTTQPIPGRGTDVQPPEPTNGQVPNWTGKGWALLTYTEPPAATAPPADVRLRWMDTGPFKDRLGMDALAIYASGHGACKAVVGMLTDRKYIWLDDPRVSALIDVLIYTAQPAADAMFPGSGPMTAAKKIAVLTPMPTEYERYIKGLQA